MRKINRTIFCLLRSHLLCWLCRQRHNNDKFVGNYQVPQWLFATLITTFPSPNVNKGEYDTRRASLIWKIFKNMKFIGNMLQYFYESLKLNLFSMDSIRFKRVVFYSFNTSASLRVCFFLREWKWFYVVQGYNLCQLHQVSKRRQATKSQNDLRNSF